MLWIGLLSVRNSFIMDSYATPFPICPRRRPRYPGHARTAREASQRPATLNGTWRMQSSCVDKAAPGAISTAGFRDSGWHKAEVPGTVVGALVAEGALPDPTCGMRHRQATVTSEPHRRVSVRQCRQVPAA